ncbi:MAG: hypothetical protein GEU80_14750 [Dehalococcoidia bacterium]|nr:hypothetical protein [Dehalococcoidia bacterium]
MPRILHLIAASLKPDADAAGLGDARSLAEGLRAADGVDRVVVGMSAEHLVVATWLPAPEALEPFAASPAHMAFIMKGLAPVIQRMWSAAVETETPPPEGERDALWAFAIGSAETMFEWQVRDLLAEAHTLPGLAASGPTVEERDRYRAGGVVALEARDRPAFEAALPSLLVRWSDAAGSIEHAIAPVIERREEP